jgi:hypothetical protein
VNIRLFSPVFHTTSVQPCLEMVMNPITESHTNCTAPDLLAQLRQIVHYVGRSDIRSVPALLSKVIGNQNAALMCIRLLYWFPRATKRDGWVYKSWRDWNAECNLSQGQVKRVHNRGYLERVGITRQTKKANGTPTTHYRLDMNQFIHSVAVFLDVSPEQIQTWMQTAAPYADGQHVPDEGVKTAQSNVSNQPNEFGQTDPTYVAETAQSITTRTTSNYKQLTYQHNKQQIRDVVVRCERPRGDIFTDLLDTMAMFGIKPSKAQQLIREYGPERVRAILDHTQTSHVHNPAGYLIRALEQGWKLGKPDGMTNIMTMLGDGRRYAQGQYAEFIRS